MIPACRNLALILLLLSIKSPAVAQLPDCNKFKEGRFRIADTQAGVVTIAERKGMYQTEYSESLKLVVRFRIDWKDNCSFTLRLDKILRNENKIDIPPGMEVYVKITSTSANSFIQEISSPVLNKAYSVQATRID